MSRLALSCRWLSSAILSVATLSIALLSPRLPTSRNVNRKGNDRSALDGWTSGERLGESPIVSLCDTVTSAVWSGSFFCWETTARTWNSGEWQRHPQPLSKHSDFRFFKIKDHWNYYISFVLILSVYYSTYILPLSPSFCITRYSVSQCQYLGFILFPSLHMSWPQRPLTSLTHQHQSWTLLMSSDIITHHNHCDCLL